VEHAALIRGQPEITTTTTIRAERISADSLNESLAPLQSVGQVYLLGTLKSKRFEEAPPIVEVAGEVVTFRYAGVSVLAGWGNQILTDIDLIIQVRHTPGVKVPEIQVLGVGEVAGPHPLLLKWIKTTEGTRN
jgi:hypothetical protein